MSEDAEGVSPVEWFVLHESDGHCQLWELAAAWTENGTEDDRRAAAPLLGDAVVSLSRRGLVQVYDFVQWPGDPASAVPLSPQQVAAAISDVRRWLWLDESTGLITVSLSDAGIRFL